MSDYRATVHKLDGAPYSVTTIYVGDQAIYSQLGPMTDTDIRDRVNAYLAPPEPPRPFVLRDKGRAGRPRGKGASPAWSVSLPAKRKDNE
ncbi:MAG TPA: hypothetical protein VMY41_16280 [Thermohalobaculum sp.]|nr:hypothetical protein [Thermohalobaculum sp.]